MRSCPRHSRREGTRTDAPAGGANRYGFTFFYTTVGEDPSLGYLWFARLPIYGRGQASANSAMHLMAELFKRQKLSNYADRSMVNKPVEEFGDLFGEYAARAATFDNQKEYIFRKRRYRLPTEAEWEYACRAGTAGCFNTGATLEGYLTLDKKSNTPNEFAYTGPCPDIVGGNRRPNGFGLYDMHGNVSEWTLDTHAPYKPGNQVDPVNYRNEAGQDVYVNEKVTRGGSYQLFIPRLKPGEKLEDKKDQFYHFRALRSASRIGIPFDFDFNMTVGFRIVLAPKREVPVPRAP